MPEISSTDPGLANQVQVGNSWTGHVCIISQLRDATEKNLLQKKKNIEEMD